MGSELGKNFTHKGGWWWWGGGGGGRGHSVKTKDHTPCHSCVLCPVASASSMAVVFPTLAAKMVAIRCSGYDDPRRSSSVWRRHREYCFLSTLSRGSEPSMISEVSLSTHAGPWWGQRKLGHLYLFVSGYADAAHPANHHSQGHALPSGSPPTTPPIPASVRLFALPSPPRCHRERPCSCPLLLSTGTPQKSQISLQFPVQCLFGERGLRGGGRAGLEKKSLTHKQFGLRSRVNMRGRGTRGRAVRRTEAGVFWSWHTDPTSAGAQSTALFRPQRPQSNKHPPSASCLLRAERPLLERWGCDKEITRYNKHVELEINISLNAVIT